jgi:hypothetical protein
MLVSLSLAAHLVLLFAFIRQGAGGRNAFLQAATVWGGLDGGCARADLRGGREGEDRTCRHHVPLPEPPGLGVIDTALIPRIGAVIALVGVVAPARRIAGTPCSTTSRVSCTGSRTGTLRSIPRGNRSTFTLPGAEFLVLTRCGAAAERSRMALRNKALEKKAWYNPRLEAPCLHNGRDRESWWVSRPTKAHRRRNRGAPSGIVRGLASLASADTVAV